MKTDKWQVTIRKLWDREMDNRIRMTENWLMLKNEHEESITEKQEGWREDKNNSRQRIVEKEDSS